MEKNNIETLAQNFSQRFKIVMDKLGIEKNSIYFNPKLAEINMSVTDYINEPGMEKVNLEEIKTIYSPDTNTIYVHNAFVNDSLLEYHLTKRFLDCMVTKKEDNKIYNGLSTTIGMANYNNALNNAINEHLANVILMTSQEKSITQSEIRDLEDSPYKNYMMERKNLFKIEEIVGSKTILESYLNSDYIQFEKEFEKYGVSFGPIAQKMDKLANLNRGQLTVINENDHTLQYEIDKDLIQAYAKKIISEPQIEKSPTFKEHLVSGETVRSIFGDKNKPGYKNVDMNIVYYERLISGLEFANLNRTSPAKTV